MLLFIDTTDSKRIVVRIETTELVKSIRSPRGEDVLPDLLLRLVEGHGDLAEGRRGDTECFRRT